MVVFDLGSLTGLSAPIKEPAFACSVEMLDFANTLKKSAISVQKFGVGSAAFVYEFP